MMLKILVFPFILIMGLGFWLQAADRQEVSAQEAEPEARVFSSLEEAQEHLESLKKERQILEGDFYGINITVYRYENVFFRLGFIRYRIEKVDEEIIRTQEIIRNWRR